MKAWYLSILLTLGTLPLASATSVTEDFEGSGSDWSTTLFPQLLASGDGTFSREPLTLSMGAPNTSPPLPINVGGDLEGRYAEQVFAPSSSYALSAIDYLDLEMDGYVGIGNPDPFGARSVAFVVRSTSSAPINAYAAIINHGIGATTATLRLVRIRNNIIGGGADNYVTSLPFAVNFSSENFRLILSVQGSSLSATLFRVHVVGGAVVEDPVDLLPGPGVQNTITANDSELSGPGRVGVHTFARGGNSIFFDDITVDDEPGGPTQNFIRGDADANGIFNGLLDAVFLLNFGFIPGSPAPMCADAADTDDNGIVNALLDGIAILNAQFIPGSPLPPPPFPGCGPDPTADMLGCGSHACP